VYLAGQHYVAAAEWFERALRARPGFAAARDRAHEARVLAARGIE
jgi:hypothetical protein